ncbi:DEAD/DEAH box helicase [Acaricomes phytoseiuli]|uniref:DEAD/DEAH box helicase n=1 Tax=Acaricomes phytoseiuli TaxID=291968 RepID=UPI0003A32B80
MSLLDYLPSGTTDADAVADVMYENFLAWNAERGIDLYPAQEEAVLELAAGSNVILATPTGSGKSLVAIAAHFAALSSYQNPEQAARKGRSYYTAPIKALVSEKFFALIEIFGAQNVGMITGDSSVNAEAPIICCTAEILANLALREGPAAAVHNVVMDEFHYVADPERGWAWQVPLLELPQAQFLLMSATLGDVSSFERELTARTGRPTAVVAHAERPIPLFYSYAQTSVQETIEELLSAHQAPVYIVHFSQAEAVERAQSLMSLNICSREQKQQIAEALISPEGTAFRFAPGFGKTLSRLLRHGIGVHHAGMLPKYRRLVEQLAQAGLLRVICGTDTLGVGINVPIRTVLLTALSKYDGQRTRHVQAREFHQIAGRAGRAGYDSAGTVVVQAPEHTVENLKALAKARAKFGDDAKKLRQVSKKKPPEGFVSWGEPIFERLTSAEPEPLNTTFTVTHAMLLQLLERSRRYAADPVAAARKLLTENRDSPSRQFALQRKALGILRELLISGVVERVPAETSSTGAVAPGLQLTVALPADFALNQPLSPFALAALELFDPEAPGYALNVVSLIESTLENPRQVLSAQLKRARTEAVAEMKESGLDYNARMAALDEISYPQPQAELLRQSFETYRAAAPWLGDVEVEPKSVVRDMLERAMNFGEYVRFYGLARSEGVLLRYLSDAYRALQHSVPPAALTEELRDIVAWLGQIVRQTDSSLLQEWNALADGSAADSELPGPTQDAAGVPEPEALTDDRRAFTVMVRNELFRRVTLAARDDFEALGELDAEAGWGLARWKDALGDYWDEHEWIGDGPQARSAELFLLEAPEDSRRWRVRQIIEDPAGHRDWAIEAEVDLDASDVAGFAVVHLLRFGRS